MPSFTPEHRLDHGPSAWQEAPREFVADHPLPSTLAAFGCGIGVGLLLAALVGSDSGERREANVARRLGRRMLDAMAQAMPDSLRS